MLSCVWLLLALAAVMLGLQCAFAVAVCIVDIVNGFPPITHSTHTLIASIMVLIIQVQFR
jgi:hypothetical protein